MTNGNDQVYPKSQSRRVGKNDTGAIQEYEIVTSADGLTKREYFAAMTMTNLFGGGGMTAPEQFPEIATRAVQAADALIDALNKTATRNILASLGDLDSDDDTEELAKQDLEEAFQ